MKESKRRRSLSGAVLVMILTVMFVLIILLTATLTTVTTANQRIYTKFEENQAYYTARSALDVFTQNMLDDGSYLVNPARDYNYTESDGSAATAPMKQGEALQLDLYKIRSQNDDDMDLGFAENAVMADSTFIAGSPEDSNFALNNTDSFVENGTNVNGLEYIEYNIKLPKVSNGDDKYGTMVDKAGFQINSQDTSDATIKVEVLDRKYATSPSYTTDEINKFINNGDTSVIADNAALQTAIQNGSRNKDYMKIKITSTVKMLDTDGVAVVIFETTEKDTPATDRALTTSGNISVGSGASANILGGSAGMNTGTIPLPDGNGLGGTLFSMGDIQASTASNNLSLNEGDAIVASGGLLIPSNSTHITASSNGAYMFLGGYSVLKGYIGDSSHGVDILANTVECGDSTLDYYGNMYVNNIDIKGSQAKVISGNTYVNGEIVLDNPWSSPLWYDGDGNINMSMDMADAINNLKPIFSSGFEIKNSDGTIVIDSSNIGSVICQNGRTLSYSISSFRTINFSNDPGDANIWNSLDEVEGGIYRVYENLPFNINGENKISLPTAQSYFHDYFKDDAFNPNSGDLGLYQGPGVTPDYSNHDISTIYADTNRDALLKTGATLFEDYLDIADADRTDNLATVIADKGIPTLTTTTGSLQVDLSGGDVYYKLSGTYNGLNIEVTGEGGRLVFLIEENDSVTFNGLGGGMSIVSDKSAGENNANYVNPGASNIKNGTTKAPRVDFYAGTNAELKCQNNVFVGGYFMMPTADLRWDNGKNGWNVTYNDDPDNVSNLAIIGSVLCRNIYVGQHISILYLDKDSGANSPGEPHLTVQASHYVRN